MCGGGSKYPAGEIGGSARRRQSEPPRQRGGILIHRCRRELTYPGSWRRPDHPDPDTETARRTARHSAGHHWRRWFRTRNDDCPRRGRYLPVPARPEIVRKFSIFLGWNSKQTSERGGTAPDANPARSLNTKLRGQPGCLQMRIPRFGTSDGMGSDVAAKSGCSCHLFRIAGRAVHSVSKAANTLRPIAAAGARSGIGPNLTDGACCQRGARMQLQHSSRHLPAG